MFQDIEISPEEEEETIRKAAEIIHKHGMDVAALMVLESIKPVVFVGGHLGRAFTSPLLMLLGTNTSISGEKLFTIFEKRENIERLIVILEEMEKEDKEKKKK